MFKISFAFILLLCYSCLAENDPDFNRMNVRTSDSCKDMLESFATLSANFTFCAIRHARPIHLCQECVFIYLDVKEVYNSILHIEDMGGGSCRDQLINLDRLQVVDSGFEYTDKLWARAFCNTCFDFDERGQPKLKPIVSTILNVSSTLDECILKHHNGTTYPDVETCKKCEDSYLLLNSLYTNMRADTGQINFCMDIIDLMNTTRSTWSGTLGCCNDRKKAETIFLSISGGVFLASILFYVTVFAFTRKAEHPVIPQKRWKQTFSKRASISSAIVS